MKSNGELRLAELLFADPVALGATGDGTPVRPRRLQAWLQMVTGSEVQVARGEVPATDGGLVLLPAALPKPVEPHDGAIFRCAALVQTGLVALGLLKQRPFLARMHRDWLLRTAWMNLVGPAILQHYARQMPGIAEDWRRARSSSKAMRLMVSLSPVRREGLPGVFQELLDRTPMAAEPLALMGEASRIREQIHSADLGPAPVPWLYGVLRPEWLLASHELDEDWKKGQKPLRLLRRAMARVRKTPQRPETRLRPDATPRDGSIRVVVKDAPGGPLANWDRIIQANAREARALRRKFAALRMEPRWRGGQLEGPEVDMDRVLVALADLKAGQEPDRRLYRRFERPPLPLAVHTLVDLSASTTGAVLHAEQQAVVLFALALESLGLRAAFTGFHGQAGEVTLSTLKTFEQPLDEAARKRLANLRAQGSTRLGTVIRHTASTLERAPEPRRLMLLLSDGRPEGPDYRGLDALRDSAMAVRQVRRSGIAVHCVSLDSRDTSWLRPIFGDDHLAVGRVEELPHRLPALFSRLLVGHR